MAMEVVSSDEIQFVPATAGPLLGDCFDSLDGFLKTSSDLKATLQNLVRVGDTATSQQALQLENRLAQFEPSVTMIGQIKAGKTSLVNAMMGSPDLLPADINPWTSVVTSLHLNMQADEEDTKASFKFFGAEEWDRLLDNGGRLGELASRAGADDELEKVKAQIAEMREKSKERLGKKFEMLLGQEHNYGFFDDELIQRYVCLGDDLDDEPESAEQGRFADITKSADLYLDRPDVPIGLCIRDTPGVNDTFMMREQITISAIKDSRICVVVLSAHQALTSTDMALIRLISNVDAREVIIFVNRIDELSDPANQVGEIRDSISATLEKANAPKNIEIVFGSAYWANNAISGTLHDLAPESADAMFSWAEATLGSSETSRSPEETAWILSGVPALYKALCDRIVEGPASEILTDIKGRALNLVHGMRATNQQMMMRIEDNNSGPLDRERLDIELQSVEKKSTVAFEAAVSRVAEDFENRVDRSAQRFLDRATESLIAHLEENGESEVWHYNPMGLRVLLRSNYLVFGKQITSSVEKIFTETAQDITGIYQNVCGVSVEGFKIEPPACPNIPAPVALGQTIALDMNGGWWRNWWQRRRGYANFADQFYTMIEAETRPIIDEIKVTQVSAIRAEAQAVLVEFQQEQRRALDDIAQKSDLTQDDLKAVFGINAQQERTEIVEAALAELTKQAA